MRKLFKSSLLLFLVCSCSAHKGLYYWGNYDASSYEYLKSVDEKSTARLAETYKAIIAKPKGTTKSVPPGIYADYGFLLVQSGNNVEGKAMLEKEIALYPESSVFIQRILKMLAQ